MNDEFDPAEFAAFKPPKQDEFDPAEFASFKPSAEPAPERTWSSIPGEAISNIPASAGQFASAVAQPFIHPIETAESIKNIGQGALQKAGVLSGTEQIPYADAVSKFFADRYGGIENLKKTMATDPVGFAADISAILTGGETALARAPGIAGKVGEVAGTVGRTVDPISAATGSVRAGASVFAPGSADARILSTAGVQMTPGQIVGGPFKTIEDAITSIPILGSFVSSGRARSIESFNKAVANQALEPIGESLSKRTPAGHALVDEVETKLGKAYDRIVPKLNMIPDRQFADDLNQIKQKDLTILPKAQVDQYDSIISSRLGPPARMSGQQIKDVESELNYLASNYSKSSDPAQRGLAKALNNTLMAVRSNLERNNPVHAKELADINSGWAMYSRIRDAASRRTTSQGIFMPSELLAAIKAGDRSVGKGSFAKGDALMQTFAETGQRILPSKLPTSGTTERGMTAAGLAGLSYLAGRPELLAAGTAAALPYTAPGMGALNMLYRAHPTQYIPPISPVAGQAAFQLGRVPGLQNQSSGGRALRLAKRYRRKK